jgi:hypothetical protein
MFAKVVPMFIIYTILMTNNITKVKKMLLNQNFKEIDCFRTACKQCPYELESAYKTNSGCFYNRYGKFDIVVDKCSG